MEQRRIKCSLNQIRLMTGSPISFYSIFNLENTYSHFHGTKLCLHCSSDHYNGSSVYSIVRNYSCCASNLFSTSFKRDFKLNFNLNSSHIQIGDVKIDIGNSIQNSLENIKTRLIFCGVLLNIISFTTNNVQPLIKFKGIQDLTVYAQTDNISGLLLKFGKSGAKIVLNLPLVESTEFKTMKVFTSVKNSSWSGLFDNIARDYSIQLKIKSFIRGKDIITGFKINNMSTESDWLYHFLINNKHDIRIFLMNYVKIRLIPKYMSVKCDNKSNLILSGDVSMFLNWINSLIEDRNNMDRVNLVLDDVESNHYSSVSFLNACDDPLCLNPFHCKCIMDKINN